MTEKSSALSWPSHHRVRVYSNDCYSSYALQQGLTPLMVACANDMIPIVMNFIEKGVNIHTKDEGICFCLTICRPWCDIVSAIGGHDAIMHAAASGGGELVETLLDRGSDIESKGLVSGSWCHGWTNAETWYHQWSDLILSNSTGKHLSW